jgi:quercetin dioxygenase-like cupin family protein
MDNPSGQSGELVVTRRCLLGVTGMGLLATSGPGLAQIPMIPDVTERRKATMDIKRNGSRPSTKAPEAYFSGAVRVEPVFQVGEPVRLNGGSVTFEPGARTAWHTHPLGQTLIIIAGLGWVQTEGGPVKKSDPATSCGFHRGETLARATPATVVTLIFVQMLNGKNVDWLEKSATSNTNEFKAWHCRESSL